MYILFLCVNKRHLTTLTDFSVKNRGRHLRCTGYDVHFYFWPWIWGQETLKHLLANIKDDIYDFQYVSYFWSWLIDQTLTDFSVNNRGRHLLFPMYIFYIFCMRNRAALWRPPVLRTRTARSRWASSWGPASDTSSSARCSHSRFQHIDILIIWLLVAWDQGMHIAYCITRGGSKIYYWFNDS